jgi:hypothetical protein
MATGFRVELRGGELSPLYKYSEYRYELHKIGAVCIYSISSGKWIEVISALLWVRIIEAHENEENNATKKTT